MAFLSKKKYSRRGNYTGQRMYFEGGFREKDIMNNSSFIVGSRKHGTVKFYKKRKNNDRLDFTKYDTATYSLKNNRWIN